MNFLIKNLWNVLTKLNSYQIKKVYKIKTISDIDSYLNDIKAKFMRLLTLTQKLSNSEEKIIRIYLFWSQIFKSSSTKPIQSLQKKAKLSNSKNSRPTLRISPTE